ncbi:SDR family oxidoreductase [Stenotrophomonas pigmentata]|uniref:SDR family oxidoreductase n=1 Tax=Stenotrophomonas pigmentata TaxID=3055080 RepID=UPI0026EE54BD|nr:SDR family oxidoreductase [Stenotrophomonas sp. 610A2]
MGAVDGKVALVSGAARGIGAAVVHRLIEEGASVVFGDILDDDGSKLALALGERAHYVHLDVTSPNDWAAAIALAQQTFGRLDILVNNAGIVKSGSILDLSVEDWNLVIDINLNGVFLGMRAAAKALIASGAGSIINVSSTAGFLGFEDLAPYSASKFGVRGLTRSVALELGRYGVRVNSVHPGLIETPLSASRLAQDQGHVALNRAGKPNEIANMVLFLASDASSFSTGAEFVADGGALAGVIDRQVSPS